MGGAWERLIRSVKTSLAVVLKKPKEEVLITALAEIEHSVNSRPLTHISPDPRDDEALTPNHFLIGSSSGESDVGRLNFNNLCTKKQWKLAQAYTEMFWRRWLREYLPTLLPRKKWFDKGLNIKNGDIVLIADEQVPRNEWRKGILTRTFPGRDGEVRIIEVKTAKGIFLRPNRKLIKFAEV